MEKHWITLFRDTFLWVKDNDGFIYNSKKFQGFHFPVTDKIATICKELLAPDNLYSASLTYEDMESDDVQKWIHSITKENEAGYLTSQSEKKPVSFNPILKMLNDAEYYVWEHEQGFGGNLMLNIHELTFYINGTTTGSDALYRQAIFPIKKGTQLDIDSMVSFIRYSRNPFLSNVNLVGNIFLYQDCYKLIKQITDLAVYCTIQMTLQDFANHIEEVNDTQWPDSIQFSVLIDASVPVPVHSLLSLDKMERFVSVTILVSSKEEYGTLSDKFNKLPVYCDAQVIPVYKNDNLDFFEENIFLGKGDLNKTRLTKREIFMHQALNMNDFGKLTIFPDGSVYANVNMEPLGTTKNTVYSLVYHELTKGRSWLRIRDQVPCTDCVYQWLCPSPSNYELAIGKPNLCHVKP